MDTTVLAVDPDRPDNEVIRRAAAALRSGRLVAFPTETVYGLGANALDASADARIFEAKGRPSHNPIIVHAADAAAARKLAAEWPDEAERLAARFWPGPLTLVLPRGSGIPDIVTAGGPTVGIRVPANPVALAILREAAIPVAAPSANRSTEVSPTTAAHVLKSLGGRIDLIIDGGPASGGIESTVLDLASRPVRVLRPGLITAEQIEAVIGPIQAGGDTGRTDGPPRSPGTTDRHYAPRAAVHLVDSSSITPVLKRYARGAAVGWMPCGISIDFEHPELVFRPMPEQPDAYAAALYRTLHELDDRGVEEIVIQMPPDTPEWTAVRDRLRRAARPD